MTRQKWCIIQPNGDQLCHATGDEVLFDDDPVWWNEYIDSEENLYYGN